MCKQRSIKCVYAENLTEMYVVGNVLHMLNGISSCSGDNVRRKS